MARPKYSKQDDQSSTIGRLNEAHHGHAPLGRRQNLTDIRKPFEKQ